MTDRLPTLSAWERIRFLNERISKNPVLNQNRRDVVFVVLKTAKSIELAFRKSLSTKILDDHKSAVLDSKKIGLFLVGEFDEDLGMNELDFVPLYMAYSTDWLEELFKPPGVENGRKIGVA